LGILDALDVLGDLVAAGLDGSAFDPAGF